MLKRTLLKRTLAALTRSLSLLSKGQMMLEFPLLEREELMMLALGAPFGLTLPDSQASFLRQADTAALRGGAR